MEVFDRFYCWPLGLDESDAKIIKTTSALDAAKKAVVSWRDEGSLNALSFHLAVQVRNTAGVIQTIYVNQESYHEAMRIQP